MLTIGHFALVAAVLLVLAVGLPSALSAGETDPISRQGAYEGKSFDGEVRDKRSTISSRGLSAGLNARATTSSGQTYRRWG